MKHNNTPLVFTTALLLGLGTTAKATGDDAATQAEEAKLQAQLAAEYNQALTVAEQERQVAEASIKSAREQLHTASEQQQEAVEESTRARAARAAEMEKMHEELSHARRQLRETSREVARVDREVARARADSKRSSYAFSISTRPVIGVILGESDDTGIKVLGVSPDGPSERAGIRQGDVIVGMDGRVLADIDEDGNARNGFNIAMKKIKADEPITVSVERGDETLDLTVTPEVREPLTWHTVTRFPSAPSAPGAPPAPDSPEHVVTIERIVVPEIDTSAMTEQIETMRTQINERRALLEAEGFAPIDGDYEFEFHEMSEMGNFALHDANVWFGLPMAQGLRLAEINPDLGEYFKTDRGVLVLKAKADNDLQLESGDVILQVGDTQVNSPAEFMRALRDFESGDEFDIDIKRKRKDRTLKTVMPESRTSYFAPLDSGTHTFSITTTN